MYVFVRVCTCERVCWVLVDVSVGVSVHGVYTGYTCGVLTDQRNIRRKGSRVGTK